MSDDNPLPAAVPLALILAGKRHPPVVYFVRVPGGVKIGTSTNLAVRLRSMLLPVDAVLAVMPGGEDAENAMHDRFRPWQVRDGRSDEIFAIEHLLGDFTIPLRRREQIRVAMPRWRRGRRRAPALELKTGADGRAERIMAYAAGQPDGVACGEIARLTGMNRETARLDLAKLVQAGRLRPTGENRNRRYHAVTETEGK